VLPGTKWTPRRALTCAVRGAGVVVAVALVGSAAGLASAPLLQFERTADLPAFRGGAVPVQGRLAPRLPEWPLRPDEVNGSLAGAGGGLLLGLGLVLLREGRRSTFNRPDEVSRALALPTLGAIPVIVSAADRSRRRRRFVALLAAAAVVAGSAGAAIWWQWQS
jgi:hypothetical protein